MSKQLDIFFCHALVFREQRWAYAVIKMFQKIFSPYPESPSVMCTNVENGVNYELIMGSGIEGARELRDSGQVATGENIAPNKVIGFLVCIVAL